MQNRIQRISCEKLEKWIFKEIELNLNGISQENLFKWNFLNTRECKYYKYIQIPSNNRNTTGCV